MVNNTLDITTYMDLFVHRPDVYAQQQTDGSYRPVKKPIDRWAIAEHLGGMASYGVYVVSPDPQVQHPAVPDGNTVGYVVFDLDTYDEAALEFLCNEVEALVVALDIGPYGKQCLMLEHSGGKGYHIWCFFSDPVPARNARMWAAQVKEEYDFANGYGVWPALEIFPKQDTVPEGGYGNLVKLPFGVHAKSGKKSELVVHNGWATDVDSVQRLPAELVPEAPAALPTTGASGRGLTPFACVNRIIEDGAPSGIRDNAMFHLAQFILSNGTPEDLCLEWCLRVNQSFSPPLAPFEVNQKVRSAAAMSSPHPSCKPDWLEGFCPGGEHCYAPWNEREGRSKPAKVAAPQLSFREQLAERRKRR